MSASRSEAPGGEQRKRFGLGPSFRKVRQTARRMLSSLAPSKAAWFGATSGMYGLWCLMFVLFAWGFLFFNPSFEKVVGLLGLFTMLGAVTLVILVVFWLANLLDHRFRRALFLAMPPVLGFMSMMWLQRGLVVGVLLVVPVVSILCGAITSFFSRAFDSKILMRTVAFASVGISFLAVFVFGSLAPQKDPNPFLSEYHLADRTLNLPDPGKTGRYAVKSFTYGSGTDRRHAGYGREADLISRSVDGSRLDHNWTGLAGRLRTHYWGFDATTMPLQARVWMPVVEEAVETNKSFPLILIVHGNHLMEDYSEAGYAYLGEHFASHGFIFASVDENFLNSSDADYADPFHLRIGAENNVRAWLLLEHLAQWSVWNSEPGHPLHGKVDMDRIGLIGHSRGGEAVATAATFNTLDHYPDDATFDFDYHFNVRGVIAIAPVDRQYKPRHQPNPLQDMNYLVIHGSMDGDLYTFMGSAQYSRAKFSEGSERFKASLYVTGANHGQFNTSWGRNDISMPFGLSLDGRAIMAPEEQRQIAKVYFTAFMQATVNGQKEYLPLLEDGRNGARWLPDIYMINNFESSKTDWLATFEEDLNPATGSSNNTRIVANNLSQWREDYVGLKFFELYSHAVFLAWDDRVYKDIATYQINFGAPLSVERKSTLVFSASEARVSDLPHGFEALDDRGTKGSKKEQSIDWSIVLVDTNGQEARLPLSQDQVLYPQIRGLTLKFPKISSVPQSEIVMRRYSFKLSEFIKINPRLDIDRLKLIRFEFDLTRRGAVVLDDIGLHH